MCAWRSIAPVILEVVMMKRCWLWLTLPSQQLSGQEGIAA